jgi:hypothetical protein
LTFYLLYAIICIENKSKGRVSMKTKIFSIPLYGTDENVYELYYKGGYYTVEHPTNIFHITQFSGTLEECKEWLRNRVIREFGFLPSFKELM